MQPALTRHVGRIESWLTRELAASDDDAIPSVTLAQTRAGKRAIPSGRQVAIQRWRLMPGDDSPKDIATEIVESAHADAEISGGVVQYQIALTGGTDDKKAEPAVFAFTFQLANKGASTTGEVDDDETSGEFWLRAMKEMHTANLELVRTVKDLAENTLGSLGEQYAEAIRANGQIITDRKLVADDLAVLSIERHGLESGEKVKEKFIEYFAPMAQEFLRRQFELQSPVELVIDALKDPVKKNQLLTAINATDDATKQRLLAAFASTSIDVDSDGAPPNGAI